MTGLVESVSSVTELKGEIADVKRHFLCCCGECRCGASYEGSGDNQAGRNIARIRAD